MNKKRKLLGCSLIAAITLAVLPYPSLATKSSTTRLTVQDTPVVTAEVVQDQTPDQELSKYFRKYDVIRMDPAAAAAQVRNGRRLVLKSSERDFDLQMSPHDMRSADYSAQVMDSAGVAHALPKGEVFTYKGQVKGSPDAQARMSLTERGLEGAIITKQGRYFFQPARSISKKARTDDFVLYEASDLTKEGATCGVTLADEVAAQQDMAKASASNVVEAEASGPVGSLNLLKIVRISTDADGEYVASLGGATQANNQIQSILNFVDGIYQSEIGLRFQIVQQNAWADAATDPYTSTAPSTRLQEFRNHWNANFPSTGVNRRAIAHLFTGVNLDGSTIGIASFGVSCRNANFSYGLSQQFPLGSTSITAQTVILTAHEIGHNFGASHTNQTASDVPPDIANACEETIMEAAVGAGSSFCPFSRSQIVGWANAFASCLDDTLTPPPTSQDCTTTPLPVSLFANGSLGPGDCRSPSRGVQQFADRYSFNGTAGQRLNITMNATGGTLDPYLYLIAPDGYFLTQDDDSNGGSNSRIPSAGDIVLPQTGTYILEATSFGTNSFGQPQTGSYSINITIANCTLSASPSSFNFPAAGGSSSVNVTTTGTCNQYFVAPDQPTNGSSFITFSESAGTTSHTFNFTVAANGDTAGRRSFIIVGAAGPNSDIGGLRIPVNQSGTGPDCSVTPIAFGQTLNGSLGAGDCNSPVRGNGILADRYTFNAGAGQKVAMFTAAGAVGDPDTFLTLIGPNGVVLLTDDDSGGNTTNSRIPGGQKSLTLGLAGTYTIEVSGFDATNQGPYTLTLTTEAVVDSVEFSQPTFSVGEGAGTLNVNVIRSGNASPATVNYATTDNFGANCSQATGQASARCDFNTAGGTLRFAAGEISKNITLSIVDDGYVEGNETFTVTLSSPSGTSLGTPSTATVTIVDNDANATNPFDNNSFFVRQQYLDFLLREPDAGGFNSWLSILNNCQPNQGGLGSDPNCDRVFVSSGFFRSTEFGERGYWAYRYYHAALGRRPQFAEFLTDLRRLSGFLSPAEEEAQRAAFVADFMQRPEFTNIYGGLTNAANAAQFIAKLEQTAQVTLPATTTTLPGQPPQYGRQELIDKMATGQFTAAQTLRAFIEQKVVFDAFFFRAFVAMQYFGYLTRDPEDAGYNDWVDVLTNGRGNIPPGDFRHLIFGFVWSVEYRQRFGP